MLISQKPWYDHMKHLEAQSYIEEMMDWRKRAIDIPYIQFPAERKIKVIPPFSGAVARFITKRTDGKSFSVYLDCYQQLWFYDEEPYREVYALEQDSDEYSNPSRFAMSDTDWLIQFITSYN